MAIYRHTKGKEKRISSARIGLSRADPAHRLVGEIDHGLGLAGYRPEVAGQGFDHGFDLMVGVIDGVGEAEPGLSHWDRREEGHIEIEPIVQHLPAKLDRLVNPSNPDKPKRRTVEVRYGEAGFQEPGPNQIDVTVEHDLSISKFWR
jgi:hypothetical protein